MPIAALSMSLAFSRSSPSTQSPSTEQPASIGSVRVTAAAFTRLVKSPLPQFNSPAADKAAKDPSSVTLRQRSCTTSELPP